METWEIARFRGAAQRLFRANLRSVAAAAISSPLMDIFGASRLLCCCCWVAKQIEAWSHDARNFSGIHHGGVQALRSGAQVRVVQ